VIRSQKQEGVLLNPLNPDLVEVNSTPVSFECPECVLIAIVIKLGSYNLGGYTIEVAIGNADNTVGGLQRISTVVPPSMDLHNLFREID